MNSEKYRAFVRQAIADKDVSDLPGIGTRFADIFRRNDFCKV